MNQRLPLYLLACSALVACRAEVSSDTGPAVAAQARPANNVEGSSAFIADPVMALQTEALATFAGGCFWCMETPFEVLPGVSAVISGYTGGQVENPSYNAVCKGTTGHAEAIQIRYDPSRVSYETLLEVFWRQIDPTDAGGQFVDRGTQYRAEIFVHDAEQEREALASRQRLIDSARFEDPIVTAVTAFDRFWEAEDYHQDFYDKSPLRYKSYRSNSGRDKFCDRAWQAEREVELPQAQTYSKPSDEVLRERLTPLQYRVTQEEGTERAFNNEYWDNHAQGIYVDIASGEPLFGSQDKFESGTGWPSFSTPLEPQNIKLGSDLKLGYPRDEVRSANGNSHLGHVFDDGPAPTGKRYCINSAALRFIPATELEQEGYAKYSKLFGEH